MILRIKRSILSLIKSHPLITFTGINFALCASVWWLEFNSIVGNQTRLLLLISGMCVTLAAVAVIKVTKVNKQMYAKVNTDPLTGLPNRVVFLSSLETCMELSDQYPNNLVATFIMDLNGFKSVNDTLGHPVGDEALVMAASRLRSASRGHDTVCRLGGDEFGLVARVSSLEEAEQLCQRILRVFSNSFHVGGYDVDMGISIGVAMFPAHAQESVDLIRYADIAMYDAKTKRIGYSVYNNATDRNTVETLGMAAALRAAVPLDQFTLDYQLKKSLKTGLYVGAEALVRWNHPTMGLLYPASFIPTAEDTGNITALTDWVLHRAIADFCAIREAGYDLKTIAINISPYCVTTGDILVTITNGLKGKPIDATNLVFEVTETSIEHRPEHLLKVLVCLDMLGITLSIDDFGTGQSSLTYLRHLPIKEIKIDKSFVYNLTESEQDHRIVQSTIDLAHGVGCSVVAEGVETQAVEDALTGMGCDVVQGYHIARPLNLDALIKKLGEAK